MQFLFPLETKNNNLSFSELSLYFNLSHTTMTTLCWPLSPCHHSSTTTKRSHQHQPLLHHLSITTTSIRFVSLISLNQMHRPSSSITSGIPNHQISIHELLIPHSLDPPIQSRSNQMEDLQSIFLNKDGTSSFQILVPINQTE